MRARQKTRVLVISPVVVPYDAISNAARSTYFMLKQQPGLHVDFITARNGFDDLPTRYVPNAAALLLDPYYRAADVIIYSFGIHHPLHDAIVFGNTRAKQIVRFHNITPIELASKHSVPLIERSFRQLHNLKHADCIWADSQTNADVLVAHGCNPDRIFILPLVVETPQAHALQDKSSSPLEIVFVGRAVPAKGLLDGIEALGLAAAAGAPPARLSIVGNLDFSDQTYVEKCQARADQLGLRANVTFCGTADDDALQSLYHKAHALLIPTYHEGFCVPVIESLRAGCIPIGYQAGNMSNIVNGLGCLVAPGDVKALGECLKQLLVGLDAALGDHESPHLPLDQGSMSVRQFTEAAKSYVKNFSHANIEAETLQHLSRAASL